MNEAKQKGLMTELRTMLSFIELGYNVSVPYGDIEPYDFIADVDGRMLKIQCKTARPFQDVAFDVEFRRTKYKCNGKHKMVQYQPGEFDYFATWYKGKTYLIPYVENQVKLRLRFVPPRINHKGYHKAEDYEIKKVLSELIEGGKE